uniref:Uncharacterized protein n=1 Tax=Lactuca sativa TaxID=4236 RepID=A0A9R1VIZ1_LACSA|nr:hypothetical protein LSAT_V11C500294910 [Lactuca sativa]
MEQDHISKYQQWRLQVNLNKTIIRFNVHMVFKLISLESFDHDYNDFAIIQEDVSYLNIRTVGVVWICFFKVIMATYESKFSFLL